MAPLRGAKSKKKTRRYARDLDQVHGDVRDARQLAARRAQYAAADLPDLGRWYCAPCARWFESEAARAGHLRTKVHRKR